MPRGSNIVERPDLRGRTRVFRSRAAAGELLAAMLRSYREDDAIILTADCGGAAVAAPMARELNLPVSAAPAVPVRAPSDGAILGAVAWDGTVLLDDDATRRQQLLESQLEQVVARARQAAAQARAALAGEHPMPDLMRRTVVLVDDGLASDVVLRAALQALAAAEAARVLVAVPTAPSEAAARVAEQAFAVYCPNLRDGGAFSVAEAYEEWAELTPEAARELIAPFLPPA